jgi:hypothetical protein
MHSIGKEPYPHEQLLQTFLRSLACPHLIAYLHSLSDPDWGPWSCSSVPAHAM